MPSQLVKATPGASTATPPGLPKAPPGMMWQETNQQVPTGLMRLNSPTQYGGALKDVNANWLLKVLQGAPGSVSAGEKALIDNLRKQYTTASGELKLPADIMDQLRKGVGSAGETVQMEGWQPTGGYSGPSAGWNLNDPRMDNTMPYSAPTAPSIKSPNAYFKNSNSQQSLPSMYYPGVDQSWIDKYINNPNFSFAKPPDITGKPVEESQSVLYAAGPSGPPIQRKLDKNGMPIVEPSLPAMGAAGNNIASGAVAPPNPGSAMSGTQLSTTAPNTGTIGTDINQSPFSPTAGTRKRTSPNKYFNQRWFGTKQLA